jgi:hypothetical protein
MNTKQKGLLTATLQAMEETFTSNQFSRAFISLGGDPRIVHKGRMLNFIRSVADPDNPGGVRNRTWHKKGTSMPSGILEIARDFQVQEPGIQQTFDWPEPGNLSRIDNPEEWAIQFLKDKGYRILKTVEI